MITKFTLKIVAEELARIKFEEHCTMMDSLLEKSLRKALGNKRISIERQNLIVNQFCDAMLGITL